MPLIATGPYPFAFEPEKAKLADIEPGAVASRPATVVAERDGRPAEARR